MINYFEPRQVSLYLSGFHTIVDEKNEKQTVQLLQHNQLGKILVIDDEIQHVEKWAPLYHESIVHIPLMFAQNPQSALILGGGDLYTAYELLKYPSIERIVLCDHDPTIIDITRNFYEHGRFVCNSSKVEFIYQDAFTFIEKCHDRFDIIINDCFDTAAEIQRHPSVISQISSCMTSNGICSDLVYRHIFDLKTLTITSQYMQNIPNKAFSLVVVPEYPGILHLLSIWGKNASIHQQLNVTKNIHQLQPQFLDKCLVFNPQYCAYYLYLPPYIRNLLEEAGNA